MKKNYIEAITNQIKLYIILKDIKGVWEKSYLKGKKLTFKVTFEKRNGKVGNDFS